MNVSKLMTGAFALTVVTASTLPAFADGETPPPPVVSGVTMAQANDRKVTIEYTLADGPAVITLDVQTNATPNAAADDPGWTSIGGEAIWNATGDVWKKVEGDTTHTITWRPDQSWPGHKITGNGARAVVTAWATNNTPDYMVVDLIAGESVRFYPAADFLPKSAYDQAGAAVTNNRAFKTSKIVMRKIMAAGVPWIMGSSESEVGRNSDETAHEVTLADNFYIGVFEVTRGQWGYVTGTAVTAGEEALPANNNLPSNHIIGDTQFLGKLNAKTGLSFTLPAEAQWEFAARAGHGDGYWGDGTRLALVKSGNDYVDANLDNYGRYKYSTVSGNTLAEVGSFHPNSWGLYDMAGNLKEWCLDRYVADITGNSDGHVMTGGSKYVLRGGGYNQPADQARPAWRSSYHAANVGFGFRVACPVGIQ